MPEDEKAKPLRYTLAGLVSVVTILSVCCAYIPGMALVVVGAAPVAVGFIVFVIGDHRGREGLAIFGLVLMAMGLFVGAFLMLLVYRS